MDIVRHKPRALICDGPTNCLHFPPASFDPVCYLIVFQVPSARHFSQAIPSAPFRIPTQSNVIVACSVYEVLFEAFHVGAGASLRAEQLERPDVQWTFVQARCAGDIDGKRLHRKGAIHERAQMSSGRNNSEKQDVLRTTGVQYHMSYYVMSMPPCLRPWIEIKVALGSLLTYQ